MKITYLASAAQADIVIVPVTKALVLSKLPEDWQEVLSLAQDSGEFTGKPGDVFSGLIETDKNIQRLLFVGVGESAKQTEEKIKIIGARTYLRIGSVANKKVSVWFDKSLSDAAAFKFIEGFSLRNYLDASFKTGDTAQELQDKIITTLILPSTISAKLQNSLNDLQVVVDGIFKARNLVALPPTTLTPARLAEEAVLVGRKFPKLSVKVLDREAIEKEGMGLLLAVSRGSVHEPRLIVMTLNGDAKGDPIVLIGKGVTFDSGGYNIKPTGHMETMHTDMAGAAAVIGTMQSLATLGEKKKVIGIIPSTENLVSGDAYKPSDIITAMNGKTVEIGNTDAEGRLILADAVTYAKKHFEPKMIFDLATLTGACIVALGERYAGIFSNEDRLIKTLQSASADSGDKVWHLPLDETFMDKMKSRIADLGNTAQGSPGAGASTGAAFIGHFAEKTPWAHIDIAGPSHQQKDLEAWNPGSGVSGFGVSLMTTLVQKYLR